MNEVRDRYVYVIEDVAGTPFYVGVGKGDRLHHHVRRIGFYSRRYPHSATYQFIAHCVERGFYPEARKVCENLTVDEACEIERVLIARIGRKDLGRGPLLNANDGGHGVKNYSAETRELISRRVKEAMTPEMRSRLSKLAKARMANPEARKKVSDATKALWKTDEFRAKYFATSKSKWTPELRARQAEKTRQQFAKYGNPQLGKKRSAEARARMSLASKAVWTPEARAKQAARMLGKKLSPETRAKMSASQRKRSTSVVEVQADRL